jgi:hypothetical protein
MNFITVQPENTCFSLTVLNTDVVHKILFFSQEDLNAFMANGKSVNDHSDKKAEFVYSDFRDTAPAIDDPSAKKMWTLHIGLSKDPAGILGKMGIRFKLSKANLIS